MELNRKLRIGVFGGARGETMINVLLHHPEAELVAVCDKYRPLLDRALKEANEAGLHIEVFENFDDFIEYDMDAVVLANYANEHGVFAIKCLNKGKHVLSEVLPTETMAQAVELVETVERTGLVYAYAENYCYRSDTFEMWQKYQEGAIGMAQYGEGEYIHDCSSCWPQITYGERYHWRNIEWATFYCTHSLGPLITMTGLRPKSVVGFEVRPDEKQRDLGLLRGAGVIIATMENGAVFKSINGWLKREPGSCIWELYGRKGMMESSRGEGMATFNMYQESDRLCHGKWQHYEPVNPIDAEAKKKFSGHGGSDFFPTHFFIEKILGHEDGKYSIDIYQALDMSMPGILAYYSILDGNNSVDVPDFRDPAQREKWRYDNRCTNPKVAGPEQLLPTSSFGSHEDIPDEVYDKIRQLWLDGKSAE